MPTFFIKAMNRKYIYVIAGILVAGFVAGTVMLNDPNTEMGSPDTMQDDMSDTTGTDTMQDDMSDTTGTDTMTLSGTVNVGVMLPATGDLASHGQDNNLAVQLAAEDFNDYLAQNDADWRINLVIEDTQTDPVLALEKIQSLNSKGINLILGTQSSAELRNVKPYADSNGIMLLSPSSTSPKLAIDDNIFRLVPDDTKQGVVIAELLQHHGIKVAIPIYRADVWGDGLYESSRDNFEALGGTMDEGIRYSPEVTVFSTEAALLEDSVKRYMEEEGYDITEIAVLMISFSEAVHLLNSVTSYENLQNVQWFGSDASSNDDAITADPLASKFVSDVNFVSAQFSASGNDHYKRVQSYLIDTIGSAPNNYAYSAYDSLWVLGKTIEHTGTTDTDTIKAALPSVSKQHTGALGNIIFNDYGDLETADYELWSVVDGSWQVIGKYHASTGQLEFF